MKRAVNMWKLYLPELYQMLVIMLIGEIFGIVLIKIIVSVDSTIEGYAVLGTFVAMFLGIIVTLISAVFSYGAKFNLAVSMGCTRKEFFLSYWGGSLLFVAIEIAAVLVFGILETGLGKIMYANSLLFEEVNFLTYLMDYRVIAGLLLMVPAVGIFVGALTLKFQTKAIWAMWVVWMVACLGGAKVHDIISENPDSILADVAGSVFHFFKTVTGPVLILLFLAVCAIMFAISAILLHKQEVR